MSNQTASCTNSHQVALVQITGTESDTAVYLNGTQILSADPGTHDDSDDVREVAHNLSRALDMPVTVLEFAATDSSWDWNVVAEDLKSNGSLAPAR